MTRTTWILVGVGLIVLYLLTRRKAIVVAGAGYQATPNVVYANGKPIISGTGAQSDAAQGVALGIAAAPATVSLIGAIKDAFSSPSVAGSAPADNTAAAFSELDALTSDNTYGVYDGMDLLDEAPDAAFMG